MSSVKTLIIASRDSALAQKQVEEFASLIPQISLEPHYLKSQGDLNLQQSLLEFTPEDFFTRELDEALLRGDCDLALHSAKDLPWPLPQGLKVLALTKGLSGADSLVSAGNWSLKTLPQGARIGTSSILRKQYLLEARPDLQIVSIRGNIAQRLEYLRRGEVDGLIVASCALERLGLDQGVLLEAPTHPLQGRLALVAREERDDLASLFSGVDDRRNWGSVALVGAGPGDPQLITLRGWELLSQAQLIYHDALVDMSLLQDIPGQLIYVGKRKGEHSQTQEEIQRQLILSAMAGKKVVRLKGGDPFIFGRGGEEVSALRQAYLSYQVVPGISSALGAAAYLDLPLTHRGLGATVAFSMGYPQENILLPEADTNVVFMGRSTLGTLAKIALDQGRSPQTPVTLVENATLPSQKRISLTLEGLKDYVHPSKEPVLVILGKTAEIFSGPSWFESRKKILYTGTEPHRLMTRDWVVHHPLIQIQKIEMDPQNWEKLGWAQWLVFTSKYAVTHFFEHLYQRQGDARSLSGVKVASIGRVTTSYLLDRGIRPEIQASVESSVGVVSLFEEEKIPPSRILIPSSNLALPIIPEGLGSLGHKVQRIFVYQSAIPYNWTPVNLEDFDQVVFSSPSTVENFFTLYSSIPSELGFISRGATTQAALEARLKKDQEVLHEA